tara:strand:- start:783 stop:890 length:108 start_codon:yes stop_codon:yes gene_type:complete
MEILEKTVQNHPINSFLMFLKDFFKVFTSFKIQMV